MDPCQRVESIAEFLFSAFLFGLFFFVCSTLFCSTMLWEVSFALVLSFLSSFFEGFSFFLVVVHFQRSNLSFLLEALLPSQYFVVGRYKIKKRGNWATSTTTTKRVESIALTGCHLIHFYFVYQSVTIMTRLLYQSG